MALSLFLMLIVYNFYRLIFSIIEGELNYMSNKLEILSFILKRSFVLILLSLFISKSFQAYIFDDIVSEKIKKYKQVLISDYDKSLDKIYGKDIESIIINYEETQEYLNSLGENNLKSLKLETELQIDSIQNIINKERGEINRAITNSSFFITRISIVSKDLNFSWILTIMIIALFLSPIYIFITNPIFREYDIKYRQVNNKIISEHYDYFKKKYSELMKKSTDLDIVYEEKYQDPPYNSIKIHSSEKYLKKGSLIKWINKYGK